MIDRSTIRIAGSLAVVLLLSASHLSAQQGGDDYLPLSFGIAAGFGISTYGGSVDVGANPALGGGVCGELDGGGGSGIAVGAFAEYSLRPTVSFGLRAFLETYAGIMTADLATTYVRVPSTAVIPVEAQHQLDMQLPVQSFELYALFAPFSFPLRISGGPKIGIPSSPGFTFAEEITADGEIAFANGTKRQEYAAGTAASNIIYGLHIGVDYDLPMGGPLSFQPAIVFFTHANGILEGEEGPVVSGLRATVGMHYRLEKPDLDPPILLAAEPTPPPAPPPPPVLEVEPDDLIVSVRPWTSDELGNQSDELAVAVSSRVEVSEIPLLPYVFFDKEKSDVPQRYQEPGGDDLPPQIATYRALLDIVGERMSRSPGSIRLVGSSDGTAEERGGEIGLERANAVADYLTKRWGIDRDRMKRSGRGLPSNPTNPDLPGADAENRRVEIESIGSADYLTPWRQVDTTRTMVAAPLTFNVEKESGGTVNNWKLTLRAGGAQIRDVVGASQMPNQIGTELTDREVHRLLTPDHLDWRLTAKDENGKETTVEGKMPIVRTVEETEVQALENTTTLRTPVLFDYNSAVVGAEERATLLAFRNRLPEGSSLRIIGYADELGESDYNRKLSGRRAEAVAALFPGYEVTIEAAGEDQATRGDGTPEGRYYERTVSIVVSR